METNSELHTTGALPTANVPGLPVGYEAGWIKGSQCGRFGGKKILLPLPEI